MSKGKDKKEREYRGKYHIVGKSVTAETFSKKDCPNHSHITYREVKVLHEQGEIQPVDGVREHAKDWEGREPDYLFEWILPGVLRYKRDIPVRGLSSKYGMYLAEQLRKKMPWAKIMVGQMKA